MYLWLARKGEELKKAELDYEQSVIELQMIEFIKLLDGDSSEVVQPEVGTKVISVLEKILD